METTICDKCSSTVNTMLFEANKDDLKKRRREAIGVLQRARLSRKAKYKRNKFAHAFNDNFRTVDPDMIDILIEGDVELFLMQPYPFKRVADGRE